MELNTSAWTQQCAPDIVNMQLSKQKQSLKALLFSSMNASCLLMPARPENKTAG